MATLRRTVELLWVVVLVAFIVVPTLPDSVHPWVPTMKGWALRLSLKQNWKMYAPNPQRSQTHMNLTAVYRDGREQELEETRQERNGWHTNWMWTKTRVDIWRQYANFHPKKRSRNRIWYLRAACVREARKGQVPQMLRMEQVKRRFAPAARVRQGKGGLGRPKRSLVTVQYCQSKVVQEMIERDRVHRGVDDAPIQG